MDLSLVIPAYNEQENIRELHQRIAGALQGKSYEVIFIDDGSTDSTFEEMLKVKKKDSRVRIIKFRKNFGQTAAWDTGFRHAQGKFIVTMDADLQNDPADIPKLMAKIQEGYDVVSGWRKDRKDSFSKKFFSNISLAMRKAIIDDKIHDSGCSLKIYTRDAVKDLGLQGEMHRYITEMLSLRGFKIGEIPVVHSQRKKGKTKYNLIRVPKGFMDLLVIAFWQKYAARPIHLFGFMGIALGLFGFICGLISIYLKIFHGQDLSNTFLPILAVLSVILGVQFFISGILADILIKTYYQDKQHYSIERIY